MTNVVMTLRIPPPVHLVDADHHGRGTQIRGRKASELSPFLTPINQLDI